MRQLFLAIVLLVVPVGLFAAGYGYLRPPEATSASLGDLAPLVAIVRDTQGLAASGDLAAAETRLTDFETAWDDAESTMRPLNPAAWGHVDDAADAALHALRAASPQADDVAATLKGLDAALANPMAGAEGGGVEMLSGIAVTDATGHPLPCEEMLRSLAATRPAASDPAVDDLAAQATERCNADDDRNSNRLSAQALALLAAPKGATP